MDEKDLNIENILCEKHKPKKKVDGKAKGNRTELELCKLLTEHFKQDFTRSVGSGNRYSQVSLPEYAKQVFSGDLCCPKSFSFVIESKGGYNDTDLNNIFEGITQINKFMEQSEKDSVYCGRKPLVCWKRNRKPWMAMMRLEDLAPYKEEIFEYRIIYCNWLIVSLENLLEKTDRKFWFKDEN